MFKHIFRAFDWSGTTVDTVLTQPSAEPGSVLAGYVEIHARKLISIEQLVIDLVARVEDSDDPYQAEVNRFEVYGALGVADGQNLNIPFRFRIPWETPFTSADPSLTARVSVGLQTELAISHEIDKSDFDAISITPLPAQQHIMNILRQRGFTLTQHRFAEGKSPILGQRPARFFQTLTYERRGSGRGEVDVAFAGERDGVSVAFGSHGSRKAKIHRFHVGHGDPGELRLAKEFDQWWA